MRTVAAWVVGTADPGAAAPGEADGVGEALDVLDELDPQPATRAPATRSGTRRWAKVIPACARPAPTRITPLRRRGGCPRAPAPAASPGVPALPAGARRPEPGPRSAGR